MTDIMTMNGWLCGSGSQTNTIVTLLHWKVRGEFGENGVFSAI